MKEKQWSVYFQNPEFLERTRMFLISEEMKPLVHRWCGVKAGIRMLDVGAGTGYFTRFLASGEQKITAVGLDRDENFVAYARRKACEQGLNIEYVVGDALALPFEDQSFDLVVSHTFFTSIPDPDTAMAEMKRVLRPGGMIAAITCMDFDPEVQEAGRYPADCTWVEDFNRLFYKFYDACFEIDPLEPRMDGASPALMPRFFAESGLKEVSAYPLGKLFSLSNAVVSEKEKLEYLDLYQQSEEKKLDVFMALPEMAAYFTKEEAEEYRRLIREKCDWRRKNLQENTVWEWMGGCNLLVTGRKAGSHDAV